MPREGLAVHGQKRHEAPVLVRFLLHGALLAFLQELRHELDVVDIDVERFGHFFRGGFAAQLPQKLLPDMGVAGDHRADIGRLVTDGLGDGLADPPPCIGGKPDPAAPVVSLHGLEEPQVAFLDEIQK